MNDTSTVDATSFVPSAIRVVEVGCAPRTQAPVPTVQGTGLPVGGPSYRTLDRTRLPFVGIDARFGALGLDGVMASEPVKGTDVRNAAIDAAQGTSPPRRTPSRC